MIIFCTIFIELYRLKKILNLFILFSLSDEISNGYFCVVKEYILHKIFDFLVIDLVRNGKNFKTGTTSAIHHKLQLDRLEIIDLIEIKHIK